MDRTEGGRPDRMAANLCRAPEPGRRPGEEPVDLPAVLLAGPADEADLRRRLRAGEVVRVRRGVYAPTRAPAGPARDARWLSLVRALAVQHRTRIDLCFSHETAALLWGLPVLRPSGRVHVIQPGRPTVRGADHLVRHHGALPRAQVVQITDLPVTSLERTVLDCACSLPADRGLVLADAALRRGADLELLGGLLAARAGRRGVRRARLVLDAADARSESAGESLTRWAVIRAGLPRPELQVPVDTGRGRRYIDLGWPDRRVGVEFDGYVKYSGGGSSAAAVLFEEKRRQDALDEEGWRLVRVTWQDLRDPVLVVERIGRAPARPLS